MNVNKLLREVLLIIFEGNNTYANPGKIFFWKGLKRQKLDLYTFHLESGFFKKKLSVWQEPEQIQAQQQLNVPGWNSDYGYLDISVLRQKVAKQFEQFRASGD